MRSHARIRLTWLTLAATPFALAACAPDSDPAGKVWHAWDYTPGFGASFTYVDPSAPTGELLQLFVGNDTWEFRKGADFDSGTPYLSWTATVTNAEGLVVEGTTVIPPDFAEGDSFDNGTITAIGEVQVEIGTFDNGIWVEVDSGPLAGDAAFVIGTGPAALTIEGTTWETSAYTLP